MNTVDIYGDIPVIADIINDEFEGEFVDDTFTSVRANLFRDCTGLTKATCENVTTINNYAFANTGLTEITEDDFPNATTLYNYAFANCSDLRTATFPKPTSFTGASGTNAPFYGCTNLEVYFPNLATMVAGNYDGFLDYATVPDILPEHFPNLTSITGNYAFRYVYGLTRFITFAGTVNSYRMFYSSSCGNTLRVVRCPNATLNSEWLYCATNSTVKGATALRLLDAKISSISSNYLFYYGGGENTVLETIILRNTDAITTLGGTTGNFVKYSPLKSGGTGVDIYVPSALLEEYKAATNWVTLVDTYGTARFHALEGSDYEDPEYDYDTGMED